MKDAFKNMDELLQKTLEGYEKEPSVGLWKRISWRLFLAHWGIYIALTVFIVGLIAALLLLPENQPSQQFYQIPQQIDSVSNTLNLPLNENKRDHSQVIIVNEKSGLKDTAASSFKSNQTEQVNKANVIAGSMNSANAGESAIEMGKSAAIDKPPTNQILFSRQKHETYPGLIRLNTAVAEIPLHPIFKEFRFNQSYLFPFIELRSEDINLPSIPADDYIEINNLWFAFHVTPEAIFMQDKTVKKAVDFDFTGMYRKQDWYIEAGAGVAISEDDGTFIINYAQNDSIGYFYKVTSFDIDPTTGKPVFNTNVEGVYDTVPYNQTEVMKNKYYYLRFPVYAGLKVYNYKRFSVFLKAGAVYSVLTNKNEPDINFINDKATWIQITNQTPQRIHSNLQLSAGVGLIYGITNKLEVSVEPVYNYYLNSVYDRSYNSKSPWSLGLRTGINFKF